MQANAKLMMFKLRTGAWNNGAKRETVESRGRTTDESLLGPSPAKGCLVNSPECLPGTRMVATAAPVKTER